MKNRIKRIANLWEISLNKRASDDLSEPKIQMTTEDDIITIHSGSADSLSLYLSGINSLLEAELQGMDDFEHKLKDQDLRTDPRAEKVYSYLADAHENIYNAIMFLNHIKDGTGD